MIPLGKAGSAHDTVTVSSPTPVKLKVPTGSGANESDGTISINIIYHRVCEI